MVSDQSLTGHQTVTDLSLADQFHEGLGSEILSYWPGTHWRQVADRLQCKLLIKQSCHTGIISQQTL